jgi:23S rRNA (guanosine2251-2'-O)-methyltransferase
MKKFPLVVVLDNIRSALNVGAMFRTSDGAGVQKIYLTGITPYPPHNKIPKTALGAIEMMDWEYNKNTIDVLNNLKNDGYKLISVELTENAENYSKIEYKKPTALIFGNEINGISKEILDLSDSVVYIPMYGKKESLNVATTFGIMVYEVVRQWTI